MNQNFQFQITWSQNWEIWIKIQNTETENFLHKFSSLSFDVEQFDWIEKDFVKFLIQKLHYSQEERKFFLRKWNERKFLYFLRNTDFFVFEWNKEKIFFSDEQEKFFFSQKISQTDKKFFISIKKWFFIFCDDDEIYYFNDWEIFKTKWIEQYLQFWIWNFLRDLLKMWVLKIGISSLWDVEKFLIPHLEDFSWNEIVKPEKPKIFYKNDYGLSISVERIKDGFYSDDVRFYFHYEKNSRKYNFLEWVFLNRKNQELRELDWLNTFKLFWSFWNIYPDKNVFLEKFSERTELKWEISDLENSRRDVPLERLKSNENTKFIPFLSESEENIEYYLRNFSLDEKIVNLLKEFSEEFYFEERRFYIEFEFNSLVFRKFTKKLLEFVEEINSEKNIAKLNFWKDIPTLKFSSKKITIDFWIEKMDWNVLEMNLKYFVWKDEISKNLLTRFIWDNEYILFWEASDLEDWKSSGNSEYLKCSNRKKIWEFLEFLEKFDQIWESRFHSKAWQVSEIENFLSQNKSLLKISRWKKYEEFFWEVQSLKPVWEIKIAKNLEKILRDYQKRWVYWLHFLRKYYFWGILADDMWLWKTLQTIAFMDSVKKRKKPFLVVCPKTLIFNWENEINKFSPNLKFLSIHWWISERKKIFDEKILNNSEKNKTKNKKFSEKNFDYDVIITSYSTLKQDIKKYQESEISFDTVFIDEAQHIKNHKTKTSSAIKMIDSDYKIALSWTPLENWVHEIWSIFDFAMWWFLWNYPEFRKDFENPIKKDSSKEHLNYLAGKIKPFLLRREKTEILKELPEKIEQNSFFKLSDFQEKMYKDVLASLKKNVFDKVEKDWFEKSRIEILAALTKLRQICNHPWQIDEKYLEEESWKVEIFIELLRDAIEWNHKILVFSSFVKTLNILKTKLEKEWIDFSMITGQTKNRWTEVENFEKNPDKKVFLISLKAWWTWLNLTAADTVVLFDPWWNPMVEMQAMDRAHRMWQKNVVNVYSLIWKWTIEEKMLKIKAKKKSLFNWIVSKNDEFIQNLSWEDLKGLFEY